jgi:predicted RecA/RadA family phage recombinase
MTMAAYKHGSPVTVDHTPGSAVAAGDVIVTGVTPRVAHQAIAANELGALAAGGGVYEMTGDDAIGADEAVYWDASAEKVSEDDDSGTNVFFGFTVSACAADDGKCLVRHEPQAAPAT